MSNKARIQTQTLLFTSPCFNHSTLYLPLEFLKLRLRKTQSQIPRAHHRAVLTTALCHLHLCAGVFPDDVYKIQPSEISMFYIQK